MYRNKLVYYSFVSHKLLDRCAGVLLYFSHSRLSRACSSLNLFHFTDKRKYRSRTPLASNVPRIAVGLSLCMRVAINSPIAFPVPLPEKNWKAFMNIAFEPYEGRITPGLKIHLFGGGKIDFPLRTKSAVRETPDHGEGSARVCSSKSAANSQNNNNDAFFKWSTGIGDPGSNDVLVGSGGRTNHVIHPLFWILEKREVS